MDEMNVELWSMLPTEVVERTLSFLSVPVLCRFRTVCKRWNSLICNPNFVTLCIQHARQDARFLVARYIFRKGRHRAGGDVGEYDENHVGWSFLDLNARRWYNIKKHERKVLDPSGFSLIGAMAVDGGLVCQHMEEQYDNDDVLVSVFNPIANTSQTLPVPSYSNCLMVGRSDIAVVTMVVDSVGQAYKIFVMPNLDNSELRSAVYPLMIVYESTNNQWRRSTLPSMPQITEVAVDVKCSVFFDGLLYVLMHPIEDKTHHWIWSYNHGEDTWNDTGVSIEHLELRSPHLTVTDDRLFLGSWSKNPSNLTQVRHCDRASRWSYELSEVNLENRSRSEVFVLPGAHSKHWMEDFFPFADYSRSLFNEYFPPSNLRVFGFCKSIIVLLEDSGGVSKVYDLNTCSWDVLPRNPLLPVADEGFVVFGKPMNLILPASTLWEHEIEAGTIHEGV